MFSKDISKIELTDIIDLVKNRKENEGQHLDYKKEFNANADKSKIELAKDISAFANASGGYLVIGVNNNLEIVGINKIHQDKPVTEWINQVLVSNLEPRVYYSEPRILEIPETDKIVVVIYVPESINKPHMVKDKYSYFIRINELSIPANHYNVRDMFELSQSRISHLKEFMRKRNLIDSDQPNFALNVNSKSLGNNYWENESDSIPLVLFSFIPKNISSEKIHMPLKKLKDWMHENECYQPYGIQHYFLNNLIPKIDGFTLNRFKHNKKIGYFEILNNGFFEVGFSQQVGGVGSFNNNMVNYLHLTSLIAYETALLDYAKKFYAFIGYDDEVMLQISFRNVLGYLLLGFHRSYQTRVFGHPRNENYQNFSLIHTFLPNNLTDISIREIVNLHSKKISNAFGLDHNYGFSQNGEFDLYEFNSYYSS